MEFLKRLIDHRDFPYLVREILSTGWAGPLVLVYDEHLSLVSVNVIEKATWEKIIIIKLPAHSSDKLQPLNVYSLGPLKGLWSRELNGWWKNLAQKKH